MAAKYYYVLQHAMQENTWWGTALDPKYSSIKDINGSRVTPEYLRASIDCECVKSKLMNLPYTNDSKLTTKLLAKRIGYFISGEREVLGILHCDTCEYNTYWRVQLWINVYLYPEAILWYCMPHERQKDEQFFVSYNGDDAITVTFNIDKINLL